MSIISTIKTNLTQGRHSEAIELAEKAIEDELDNQASNELFYLLTVAYRLTGKYNEALKYAKQLIIQVPEHARSYQEMGHIYKSLGNDTDAAISFYRATSFNPALIASWRALEPLYSSMGNTQASQIARKQIQYLSDLPAPVLGARDLMHEGQLHKADQVCRHFLQTHKHHPEAMLLLAEIGIQLKIYGEAEFLLESLIALHPQHLSGGMALLKLWAKMGKFKQARTLASDLLNKHPDNKALKSAKASAMVGVGEIEQAVSLYQHLLEKDPAQPGIQLLIGHALKAQGNLTEAIDAYQLAYQYKADFGDAYWSLANTKTYQFNSEEVSAMHACIEDPNTSSDDKIHFHFALGKAFEDTKQFDRAFAQYSDGNSLKQQQIQYDPNAFEQQVESQIKVCDEALFERLKHVGATDSAPIFIVGLPRAGSTLLEQILASHSQVDGTMELHNILSLASKLRGKKNQYPEVLTSLEPDYFARFGEQFLEETQVYRSGAAFFIDKMPNNFLHIGLIKLILPNAKVIDARRHPMACCFSGFKQLFGDGQEFTYGLENIGRYYAAYVKLMAHWDKVLPGFVLRVQHEDVLDDLEGQVKRLLDFCGLTFEQNCIDFHKTERAIKTPSSEQVRQPIYQSGAEQWKHFESHLRPLKEALESNLEPRS